jgi:hypothetical protein
MAISQRRILGLNPPVRDARVAAAQLHVECSHAALKKLTVTTKQVMRRILARIIAIIKSAGNDDKEICPNEAFFWMTLYNAALLESDAKELRTKVHLAIRAVEARRTVLEGTTMSAPEWNLLQYAALCSGELQRAHIMTESKPECCGRKKQLDRRDGK